MLRCALVAVLVAALASGCGRHGFDAVDGDAHGAIDMSIAPGTMGMDLSAGTSHTCAIVANALWCWGANLSAQLGLGMTGAPALSPQRVAGEWDAVAVGESHTCALDVMGDVWCWGGNGFGQLGVGDMSPRSVPTRVSTPAKVVQITSRANHVCVVLATQVINCWGRNAEGEIGIGDVFDAFSRRLLPTPPVINDNAGPIFAGYAHTLWLRTDGALWGAGRNTANEIGRGDASQFAQHRTFELVDAGPWRQLAGGQNSSCGIKADLSLWCWGANDGNNLGLGDTQQRAVPTLVLTGEWTDIDVDTFHGCGLRDGLLMCWGRTAEGQLASTQTALEGLPVVTDSSLDWVDVDIGRFYSCGQRVDGTVWCTGKGEDGVLGLGDSGDRAAWTLVPIP